MNVEIGRKNQDDWRYSFDHKELCRVIETQTLWGETVVVSGCLVKMLLFVSASRLNLYVRLQSAASTR